MFNAKQLQMSRYIWKLVISSSNATFEVTLLRPCVSKTSNVEHEELVCHYYVSFLSGYLDYFQVAKILQVGNVNCIQSKKRIKVAFSDFNPKEKI